jgi:hypothetical protein
MSDYEKLTDREVSELVAERLMGWSLIKRHAHESIWKTPSIEATTLTMFAASDNAARLVRDRIAERGLTLKFMDMLVSMCPHTSGYSHQIFEAMQATPRQQCIAALMALEVK